jgi:RimJ/RimL family protein N-acetyltransferase
MHIVWAGGSNADLRNAMIEWMCEQIWPGEEKTVNNATCMGVLEGGKPMAVIAYHDYNPDAGVIELSGAATSRRWLSRRSLNEMLAYPFEQADCQMIVTRNSAQPRQKHLHRILKSCGFKSYLIPRLAGRNEDQFIWTLTQEDWQASKFYKGGNDG